MRKVTVFNSYEITVDIEQSGDRWSANYAIEAHGEMIKRRRNLLIQTASRLDAAHIALAQAKAYIEKTTATEMFGPAVQKSRPGTSRQIV